MVRFFEELLCWFVNSQFCLDKLTHFSMNRSDVRVYPIFIHFHTRIGPLNPGNILMNIPLIVAGFIPKFDDFCIHMDGVPILPGISINICWSQSALGSFPIAIFRHTSHQTQDDLQLILQQVASGTKSQKLSTKTST